MAMKSLTYAYIIAFSFLLLIFIFNCSSLQFQVALRVQKRKSSSMDVAHQPQIGSQFVALGDLIHYSLTYSLQLFINLITYQRVSFSGRGLSFAPPKLHARVFALLLLTPHALVSSNQKSPSWVHFPPRCL